MKLICNKSLVVDLFSLARVVVVDGNIDPVTNDPVCEALCSHQAEIGAILAVLCLALTFNTFMLLMHLNRSSHTVKGNLVGLGGLLTLMYMHVPVEECGETGISKHACGEVEHALRAQVSQAILSLEVVKKLPSWITFGISLLDVHPIGVHVDWEHCLLIEIDHHEGRVLLSISRDRATNIGEHDGSAWV